jgi:serine/threonine protein kinase/predicted Zn-dependent protease
MIGKEISHYKILEKLGEGGMGVVYKAEDVKLGRYVALKFLPPHARIDEENKERFVLEAKAASIIEHTNIGVIHEIDETSDGSMYIVMACYDGESLKKKIDRGPQTIKETIEIALQIAQGMTKAHECGIIHRDLKPSNVLITSDGIAKIIDFGLAKLTGRIKLTKTGTTIGTVAYMSPEQARGDDIDNRSDIWSLGVMLYEMLTGKLPFRGEYETALLYSITNEAPQSIESFRNDIPLELKVIIDRALQKIPEKRYQRMDEFVADLKSLQIKNQMVRISGQTSESDWQAASRSISYIFRKHKLSTVYIPSAIILLLLIGFLVKTFLVKSDPTILSRSIAVLPFVNLGETEQTYLADGLVAEIANLLSDFPHMVVISQKSTSLFKTTKLENNVIAEQLGVRYLIKGELQLLTARIKIKLSLFDNNSGKEIWKENYDIVRAEIFKIKDEIVKQIAGQLGIDISSVQSIGYQTTPEVYDLYLHGIYYRDKHNKEDNLLAMTFFSEALRKDSNFLPVLLSLANSQVEQFRQGWDPSEKYLIDAKFHCEKVLRVDSNSSQALAQLGIIHDLTGYPNEGLNLLLQSIDKDKNNAVALTSTAWIYLFKLGEPTKGVMYLKQLQQIDPLDWLTAMNLGVAYGQMKNYPEAKNAFRRAIQLNPQHEWPTYCLGYTFERIAQFDSAIYYYNLSLDKNPMNPKTYEALVSVLLVDGKYTTAESMSIAGMRYLQDEPQILYGLGVTYVFMNKQSNARKFFNDGLSIVDGKIKKNPKVGDNYAIAALFNARLGNKSAAREAIVYAKQLDSTNEDVMMKVVRAYAILDQKAEMLKWFAYVKTMNPEYDGAYLRTAMDFEKYRDDHDMLSIARQ